MIKKEANDITYDLKRGYAATPYNGMMRSDNHPPVRLHRICLDDVSFLWKTRKRNQTALPWPTAYDNDMIHKQCNASRRDQKSPRKNWRERQYGRHHRYVRNARKSLCMWWETYLPNNGYPARTMEWRPRRSVRPANVSIIIPILLRRKVNEDQCQMREANEGKRGEADMTKTKYEKLMRQKSE